MEVSGLPEKLDAGEEIMADKGFLIQDIMAPIGVRLNAPPLLKSDSQITNEDDCAVKGTCGKSHWETEEFSHLTKCIACHNVGYNKSSDSCVLYANKLC